MTESSNNNKPEKRQRATANGASRKPTARKSVKLPSASKAAQESRLASTSKSAKPIKVTKQSRTSKIPKTTRSSQIPKIAATSRTGAKGGAGAQSRMTGTQPRVTGVQPRVTGTQPRVQSQSTRRSVRTSTTQPKRANFARSKTDGFASAASEKKGPKSRTPSSANEFVAFTKSHLKIMIPVFVLLALLVGYTVVDIGASFGKIHPGVSVQGVDVGGMTVDEASVKLSDELTPTLSNAHISIYENDNVAASDGVQISDSGIEQAHAAETAGSDVNDDGSIDKWSITAETIGAYIDGEALAKEAYLVGRQGNFIADRFTSWFGGTKLKASVAVRDERFNALVTEVNKEIGLPIVDSAIEVDDGVVSVVDGSDGWSVDTDSFLALFAAAVFNSERPYFVIPMKTDPMRIHPATAQKVADDVSAAIAEDVTIVHDPDTWTMDAADLGKVISQQVLAPDEVLSFGSGTQKVVSDGSVEAKYDTSAWVDSESGYTLQAYVDQEKMDNYLVGILGSLATGGAKDAYFDTSSGEVVLVESVEGYGPDRSAAEIALQDMLFGTVDAQTAAARTITLVDVVIEPELTTAKAQSMGITERLATWTIPLSGSSERINNIKLLCSFINNSLVAPGATWSFNETTGERTAEKGFQTAPVIINGKHEDQLGGGICQVATCVFNCACFSGLGIQERVNHDFYIAAYDDEGFADATVSWKSPDLKWVNDMSTYVLLTAVVTDEDVVVSFWGTKDGRTVECQRGEWKDGDKYVSITEVDPELPAGARNVTQTGQDGRSIDIRYLATAADGTVLHDITFHSIYSAQNEIITVGGAAAQPAPAPETTE